MNKLTSLTLAIMITICATVSIRADQTVTLTATSPGQAFIGLPSGRTYKANGQGNITNVDASDVPSLLAAGATIQSSGTSVSGTPGDVANFGASGTLQDSGSVLGSAAFQPSSAFDLFGAAAAVRNYITGLTGFLSCNGTACTGSSTIPATALSGAITVANGGTGQVSGLIYNTQTGAAENTNVALIQAALNARGPVQIACPANSVIWVNTAITIYSNTDLNLLSTCTIKADSGTGLVFANSAATSAFTTLWGGAGNSSGPTSIIGAFPYSGWSSNHAYVAGAYIQNSGNIYWASTAGTSASSGGPSGTGTSITDGTVTWQYVTTYFNAYNTWNIFNTAQQVTVLWPNHGLSVGQAVWIAPAPDSGLWWSGVGSAGQLGGPADSAYFGVFSIEAVNDANSFTVALRRAPTSAFSGIPIQIKQADQDIAIRGDGVIDGNYPANNVTTNSFSIMNVVFAGIKGFKVDRLRSQNASATGFNFDLGGLSAADLGGLSIGPAGSTRDRMKLYGSAFDVHVHDSYGADGSVITGIGDDILTISPEEASQYKQLMIPGAIGDILNVKVENVSMDSGQRVGAYFANPLLLMDNIDISHTGSTFSTNVTLKDFGGGGGTINNLSIHDMSYTATGVCMVDLNCNGNTCGSDVVNNLNITNVGLSQTIGTAAPTDTCLVGLETPSPMTVNNLTLEHITGNDTGALVYVGSGKLNNVTLNASNITLSGAGTLFSGTFTNSTLNNLVISNNTFLGSSSNALMQVSVAANTEFVNNYIPNFGGNIFNYSANDYVYAAGNNAPNAALLTTTGTTSIKLASGGGNVFSNVWTRASSGTQTLTDYGWDILCDVKNLSRATGEFCYNTDTSPGSGTLTTAGPVMDQGTSANSWFLMSNPSGQQY